MARAVFVLAGVVVAMVAGCGQGPASAPAATPAERDGGLTAGYPAATLAAVGAEARRGNWSRVFDHLSMRTRAESDLLFGTREIDPRETFAYWIAETMDAKPLRDAFQGDVIQQKSGGSRAVVTVRRANGLPLSIEMVHEAGAWRLDIPLQRYSVTAALQADLRIYERQATAYDCKAALAGIRASIASFFADRAIAGESRWPHLGEVTERGVVLPYSLPKNPYSHDARVARATRAQAEARQIVGDGEGWAYYDATDGGIAIFYANSASAGENAW